MNNATVAIAHTKEKHRSMARVYPLVKQAIDYLGGMQQFVGPGQTVLIKPNQTVFYSAEEGCIAGTVDHVKSALDAMLQRGELNKVIWLKGTPTIMIGEVDDPEFEMHLQEGPYVVCDDAAKSPYKNDPRVYFVRGHPVLRAALPELMKGLGVSWPGEAALKWQQFERWGMHNLEYGSARRKVITVSKPIAAIGLATTGLALIAMLSKRLARKGKHDSASRQTEPDN